MSSAKRIEPTEVRVEDLPLQTGSIKTRPGRSTLRTSEIRYRRLFEAARDGILILDATTLKITDVNPFMTELLGYTRAQFIGKELWEIGFFVNKEASQKAFQELQAKGYIRFEDLPLQTSQGEIREVEFVSNVYDEDNQDVIQCNIRDITERKLAETERGVLLHDAQGARAEADSANTVKDEFLAILSHELRTPLTSILGWSKMLADGDLGPEESRHALEIIVRNARAQRQLIDDLLDVSRIITGKLRLEVRKVELEPLIRAVIDGLRPAADAKDIKLQIELDANISPILGDPDRLQQVIWNLLTNAIKFTPPGGEVRIRLEQLDSQVAITIDDTGLGIEAELLPYVFDRFRQSDSSTTRNHGGLGLGLSIVRQLVELHGGIVTVNSPGAGGGTTFTVMLPTKDADDEVNENKIWLTTHAETPLEHQPSLDGLRVLVVDDEQDARELVVAVLTNRKAKVVSVGSADEALEELERERFDVLVSDIGMPNVDGYSLISKVRQLPAERGGRIPAAALTAYAGIEARRRVLLAGYHAHIAKPVEPAKLTSVVASLAESHGKFVAL